MRDAILGPPTDYITLLPPLPLSYPPTAMLTPNDKLTVHLVHILSKKYLCLELLPTLKENVNACVF